MKLTKKWHGFTQGVSTRLAWLAPWCELLRIPNLFTVYGDVLAGAALGWLTLGNWETLSIGRVFAATMASVLLYAYGLIENDWVDAPEDSRMRPERPIPSGRISSLAAALAGLACAAAGMVLAACCGRRVFLVALVLLLAISAYNFWLKGNRMAGAVGMGLCRGLSMTLGCMLFGFTVPMLFPVLGVAVFIALVTLLADREDVAQQPTEHVFYPSLAFLAAWVITVPCLFSRIGGWGCGGSLLLVLLAIALSLHAAFRVYGHRVGPRQMHPFIGHLILCLIPWQSSWCLLAVPHHTVAILLFALLSYLLANGLARHFSQS
ncbi:MAG: UbiA family prenyltransferase [Victivallales bacterium]|nr:UbiA family prenyltransferase [Victivallales bacterium]